MFKQKFAQIISMLSYFNLNSMIKLSLEAGYSFDNTNILPNHSSVRMNSNIFFE